MLTISAQQKKSFIQEHQLKEVIMWLKMNIDHLHVYSHVYETSGLYNQLHFHGIVSVDKYFSYRPFTVYGDIMYTQNTFRVQWTKITDLIGAYNYLKKDLVWNNQDEILVLNIYKHNYFDIGTQKYLNLA